MSFVIRCTTNTTLPCFHPSKTKFSGGGFLVFHIFCQTIMKNINMIVHVHDHIKLHNQTTHKYKRRSKQKLYIKLGRIFFYKIFTCTIINLTPPSRGSPKITHVLFVRVIFILYIFTHISIQFLFMVFWSPKDLVYPIFKNLRLHVFFVLFSFSTHKILQQRTALVCCV